MIEKKSGTFILSKLQLTTPAVNQAFVRKKKQIETSA